jgi:hypothetical protein
VSEPLDLDFLSAPKGAAANTSLQYIELRFFIVTNRNAYFFIYRPHPITYFSREYRHNITDFWKYQRPYESRARKFLRRSLLKTAAEVSLKTSAAVIFTSFVYLSF